MASIAYLTFFYKERTLPDLSRRLDYQWSSMLHYAAGRRGSPDTICALVDAGCRTANSFNRQGRSPLSVAVQYGRWDSACTILDMGGTSIHRHGRFIFDWDREIRTTLTRYDEGAEAGGLVAHRAGNVSRWREDALHFMRKLIRNFPIARNGVPSTQRLRSKINWALFFVVGGDWRMKDPAKAVAMLLDLGADPNCKDLDGATILHSTLDPDNPKEFQEGASAEDQLNEEARDLEIMYNKSWGVITALLKHGASLDVNDHRGLTPIEYFIKRFDPTRLAPPSAPGNRTYRLQVLKFIRLMIEFSQPRVFPRETRLANRIAKGNEAKRWKAWADKEENELEEKKL